MVTREQLAAVLGDAGQQHVLRFFDQLDEAEREQLAADLAAIDLRYVARAMAEQPTPTTERQVKPYQQVIRRDDARAAEARRRGEVALSAGRMGVLLVAGGAGTRLGFDGPKGFFPVGPISDASLFQLHLERLVAAGARYGVVPPLYIMTSPENHEATCAFMEQHQRFGLPTEKVLIFPQGQAPAVDEAGKLLLADRHRLVLAPNGNGGLFAAMETGGAFAHMREHGVEMISYIQVDNALADSCDPLFCGYHLLLEADFSCKAMPKVTALEKVGNYALVDGRLGIVEYYEIPDELAEAKDERHELLFNYGNPGLFLWSRTFAEHQAARMDLPIHRAHKQIPHLDQDGRQVEPEKPNGYKLEMFALDTLADAEHPLVLAIDRDAEFAPVKNATGVDSPDSARALMIALHRSWLLRAGFELAAGSRVEVGPKVALDEGELCARADAVATKLGSRRIAGDVYLDTLD